AGPFRATGVKSESPFVACLLAFPQPVNKMAGSLTRKVQHVRSHPHFHTQSLAAGRDAEFVAIARFDIGLDSEFVEADRAIGLGDNGRALAAGGTPTMTPGH